MRFAAFTLLVLACPALPAAQCAAVSGPGTAALVELYTAEKCAGCTAADRWLAGLGSKGYPAGAVVAVALHVDYRDYTGREEHFARRRLTPLQRNAFVYSPQVLLQGREFRDWGTPAFDEALGRILAQPARARIGLRILGGTETVLELEASVQADGLPAGAAALYMAAYGTRLQGGGARQGKIGLHDRVVLEWLGPFALEGESVRVRKALPLLPRARPAESGAVAFVHDRRSLQVLQALLLPNCGA